MAADADGLATRLTRLRAQVARHKGAIKREKALLHAAATELTQIEAECRRLGIGLVADAPSGVGANHGRLDPRP